MVVPVIKEKGELVGDNLAFTVNFSYKKASITRGFLSY
jgi:hypothetical protein